MKKITKRPPVQSRFRIFPDELAELLGRNPSPDRLALAGISPAQYCRWLSGPGVWMPAAQYRMICFMHRMALAEVLGPSWEGFEIRGDMLLFPGLNRPLSAADLRSTWLYLQRIAGQDAHISRLQAENARLLSRVDKAEQAAAFYRHQLILESRMGMMLNRVFP